MPYYRAIGEFPRKRHVRFLRPDGGLYAEELMGEEGFSSDSSLLYHRYLPLIEFVGGQAYVAGTKALLTHMGFAAGPPRPPRLPLPPEHDAVARELVSRFELRIRR